MNFLARLVSDNSRSLENLSWEHCPPKPPIRKKFCMGSEFLFIATYESDLTFLAPLTSEICNGFPKLGLETLIRGHSRGSEDDQGVNGSRIGKYLCAIDHHNLLPWLTLKRRRSRLQEFHFKYLQNDDRYD